MVVLVVIFVIVAAIVFVLGIIASIEYFLYKDYKTIEPDSELYSEILNNLLEKRLTKVGEIGFHYFSEQFNSAILDYVDNNIIPNFWMFHSNSGTFRIPKRSQVENLLNNLIEEEKNKYDYLVKQKLDNTPIVIIDEEKETKNDVS